MKDFNLHKYLRDNPLTGQNKTLSKGKINEAFEGFGGVRSVAPIHEAPVQSKDFNWDPTDTADYDEQSQPNKWIADLDRMQPQYGDWKASWEHPGLIVWSNADVPDAVVVATPGWDGPGTPIEFQSAAGSSQMLKVLDQDVFPTFKDYLKAVKPYLDMVLDANVNPTSTDYEKSPIKAPGMEKFQGVHEADDPFIQAQTDAANMKTLFVFDYGSGTVYEKMIPGDMQSEEIDEMLADEYGLNSDDIYYMVTSKKEVKDLDSVGVDENYMGTQYDSSEDMAVDKLKKGIRENDYFNRRRMSDDDMRTMPSSNERLEGLINQRELAKFGEAVMAISQDLIDDGFDAEDVKRFLVNKLNDMIID